MRPFPTKTGRRSKSVRGNAAKCRGPEEGVQQWVGRTLFLARNVVCVRTMDRHGRGAPRGAWHRALPRRLRRGPNGNVFDGSRFCRRCTECPPHALAALGVALALGARVRANGSSARSPVGAPSRLRARGRAQRARVLAGTAACAGAGGLAFPAGVVRPGALPASCVHALGGPRSVARRCERSRGTALRALPWRADEREPASDDHISESPPRRSAARTGAATLGPLALLADPAAPRASGAAHRLWCHRPAVRPRPVQPRADRARPAPRRDPREPLRRSCLCSRSAARGASARRSRGLLVAG
jgi:hypothetical protein